MSVTLHGWAFSPYLRAVRIALEEKGVAYGLNELTPADLAGETGLALTPFGRVPVLEHEGLRLLETPAMLRYVDEAFIGAPLQPATAAARAETAMLLGLAANEFYPSGVMGVFFQEVYIPANGGVADAAVVASALVASEPFLAFLERRLETDFLVGDSFSLADALVGTMLHNFSLAPAGAGKLETLPRVQAWLARVAGRPSFAKTDVPVPLFGLPA
jgi:glutathione S-transferase